MEHSQRVTEFPEHEEARTKELIQKSRAFILKRIKRLLPERTEHDESWSEQFGRILMWALLGLAGLCAMALLVILAKVLSWLSAELAPWFAYVVYPCWAVVIILTPLAFIRQTKPYARLGLLIAACLFGAILWLGSIELLSGAWGIFAVFVGLCLLGVGVVPLAFLAALFTGDWGGLFVLLVLLTSTAGMAFVVRRMDSKPATARGVVTGIANQSELG